MVPGEDRYKLYNALKYHGIACAHGQNANKSANIMRAVPPPVPTVGPPDTPREVAEAALAHAVGDKAEAAYRRGTALEKRRALMEELARYLGGDWL